MLGTEIAHEQAHLDLLYTEVDRMRAEPAALPDPGHSPDPDAEAAWRSRQAARLAAVEHGLCFGRIDGEDGEALHIGRMGLFRDVDDTTLLLDWRAPAARPFYTATARSPQGVRRRRRISTEGRTVVDLDDELLAGDQTGAGDLTALRARPQRPLRGHDPGDPPAGCRARSPRGWSTYPFGCTRVQRCRPHRLRELITPRRGPSGRHGRVSGTALPVQPIAESDWRPDGRRSRP